MNCSGTSHSMCPRPAQPKFKAVICMRVSSGMLAICWRYTHDGKEKTAKQVIQSIDEEKKLIQFKVLEGDVMEEFKTFVVTTHVETKDNIDLVTWTLEYEMLNEDVQHRISLLEYFIDLTKDIKTHHVGKP